MLVKHAHTFEVVIWATNSPLREITTTTKTSLQKTNNKYGSKQEGKWCKQCMKKDFGDCVIYFKCKKLEHISTNFTVKRRDCFNYGEEWHIKVECPKVEKVIPRILPLKPKGRSYQMTFKEA